MPSHLMTTYAPMPVAFTHGSGAWLWDEGGRKILDTASGIGVCSLGHGHPEVAQALADQASKVIHTANVARIPNQESAAERLCNLSKMQAAFFCSSGAESVECALKLARLWGERKGISAPKTVVFEGAFHGRTLACLSASHSRKVQAGFEPLVEGFVRVPFNDADALEASLAGANDIAAVLIEPIQGEGGIRVPDDGFLQKVRHLCDKFEVLFMADEVQSGICKTGRWFAWQHADAKPDVISVAKALGNGFPIGACLADGEAAKLFSPGKHGSTYGGNPLGCRVADTVLQIMERDNIAQRAELLGGQLKKMLRDALKDQPRVREIRGKGLMLGIELDRPAAPIKLDALERYAVLLNVTRDNVIRLLPPLVIEESDLGLIVEAVSGTVEKL